MLNLHVQKGTRITLHEQLVTQLSLQIAAGTLPSGTRLPSVRQLSRQLGLHYNTCLAVYKELGELGLVEAKRGSGVRVTAFHGSIEIPSGESGELYQMVRFLVTHALQKGYGLDAIRQAVDSVCREPGFSQPECSTLVFVDIHADILPLFQAELSQGLNRPVAAMLLSEVVPQPENTYLVSRYHYRALKEHLGACEATVWIIDVESGQSELALIRTLPQGAMVVIVSHSSIILQMGEALVHGLDGRDLSVRTLLVSEGASEIQRVLRHGDFVIGDFLSTEGLRSWTRHPVQCIRVVPVSEIEKLKARLGFPPEV